MTRLAFSGEARHPDLDDGYGLYVRRSRSGKVMDRGAYGRVVRGYCRMLADSLCEDGMADLPAGFGYIAAVTFRRRPQYRGGRFVGYGAMDWDKGHRDGTPTAFGLAYFPGRGKTANLRCYGFVANRRLFKRMKERSLDYGCPWRPMEFNDEMV